LGKKEKWNGSEKMKRRRAKRKYGSTKSEKLKRR